MGGSQAGSSAWPPSTYTRASPWRYSGTAAALTMEIYTQVPDKVTRDALRRLSDQLDSDQADEHEPGAAGPGQQGIE